MNCIKDEGQASMDRMISYELLRWIIKKRAYKYLARGVVKDEKESLSWIFFNYHMALRIDAWLKSKHSKNYVKTMFGSTYFTKYIFTMLNYDGNLCDNYLPCVNLKYLHAYNILYSLNRDWHTGWFKSPGTRGYLEQSKCLYKYKVLGIEDFSLAIRLWPWPWPWPWPLRPNKVKFVFLNGNLYFLWLIQKWRKILRSIWPWPWP